MAALASACTAGGNDPSGEPLPPDPSDPGGWVVWFEPLRGGVNVWRPGAAVRPIDVTLHFDSTGEVMLARSPDGRFLADWGDEALHVIDLATGTRRKVEGPQTGLQGLGSGARVAWSQDAQHLAFIAGGQLVLARGDGSDPKIVGAAKGDTVCFSRTSKVLATSRSAGTWALVDVASAREVAVANPPPAVALRLSPRGNHVAVLAGEAGVVIVGADGSVERTVTPAGALLGWSSDGEWLAMLAPNGIRLVPAGSGPPVDVPLTNPDSLRGTWSPTGAQLLVTTSGRCEGACAFVVETSGATHPIAIEGPELDEGQWSPDGAHLIVGALTRATRGHKASLVARDGWAEVTSFEPGFVWFGPEGWLRLIPGGFARLTAPHTLTLELGDDVDEEFVLNDAKVIAYTLPAKGKLRAVGLDGTGALDVADTEPGIRARFVRVPRADQCL